MSREEAHSLPDLTKLSRVQASPVREVSSNDDVCARCGFTDGYSVFSAVCANVDQASVSCVGKKKASITEIHLAFCMEGGAVGSAL